MVRVPKYLRSGDGNGIIAGFKCGIGGVMVALSISNRKVVGSRPESVSWISEMSVVDIQL